MSGKKISDGELLESIKDSVDYLHSITSSDRFIELDEPQRILGKIGQTQKHVKSKKRNLFFRIFGKRTVKEAIARFEIKQKQAFIRRKQIWIGPVILCPTYSTQSLISVGSARFRFRRHIPKDS